MVATTYFQPRSAKEQFKAVSNSLLGGNVVTILARAAIRARSIGAAIDRKRRISRLGAEAIEYVPPAVNIAGIPVTTRFQEAYTLASDATQHPVESGAILSDHVILRPITMELSFEVSNWYKGMAEIAQDELEKMWQNRTLLELETQHKILPDMVLTNLESDNSAPVWGKLSFRATFQQIKPITLETVDFPADMVRPQEQTGGPDASKSIESPTTQGLQQPKDVSGLILLGRKIPEVFF